MLWILKTLPILIVCLISCQSVGPSERIDIQWVKGNAVPTERAEKFRCLSPEDTKELLKACQGVEP